MKRSPAFDLVTFVTDYGYEGGFVGALHSVVDAICGPSIRLLDIDHEIPRHDVVLGALRMERALAWTRPGVHVTVVDPGVGTERRGVVLRAGERVFVGPDNGVLFLAAEAAGGIAEAVALSPPEGRGGRTFDGRDVFAPAAARIAAGAEPRSLGQSIPPASIVALDRPAPLVRADGGIELLVVQVDGFGNVQFGADGRLLADLSGGVLSRPGEADSSLRVAVGKTFADVAAGEALLLSDSDECLALSVNRGRADTLFGGVHPGDRLLLAPSERSEGARR